MSRTLLVAFSILTALVAHAQGVGINNPTPDASALLDLTSTDRGLLVPRMSTIQRNAIPVPALSLIIFNTTTARFEFFDGTAWVPFVRDGWSVTGNTGTNPSTHFVGTADGQPLAFRTNGIERMRVASGAITSVGINTPTPSSTLHVLFTLPGNINSAVQLETNQATSATNIGFRNTPNSRFASLGMLSNGDFGLGIDCNFGGCGFGTEVFRVKPNGNFGIGTPNALDRLHVVGNIRMVDGNQATGHILVSDANGRASWAAPGTIASGSLDQAYDFGSVGAGRTIVADAGALTIAGTDGLVSTGTLNSGALAPTGTGVRMVWYPRKAAFRAGEAFNSDWDDTNMGQLSVAFGRARAPGTGAMAWGDYNGNLASGNNSTAWGFGATASGQYATAWGYYGNATGSNSTAWGGFLATASGTNSTAVGAGSRALSFSETVFGQNNTSYTPSSATAWVSSDRLFSIGNGTSGVARSDALVVLKNGNTGLGVSSPVHRLHVAGRSLFHDGFSPENAAMLYRNTTDYMFLGPESGSSTNGAAIALFGSGNTSTGNANGVDVNVPNGKVRFFQTNGQFEFVTNSTSGYTASFELNDFGLLLGHNSASRNIQFVNGGGERVRIDAAGRVGIGTTAPATVLQVNGAISTTPMDAIASSNPFIFAPGDRTYVRMGSNNVPTSRFVTLAAGLTPGQMLIIECSATGSNGIQFMDNVLQNVGGSKQLLGEDAITFIWNGTKWILTSYADN